MDGRGREGMEEDKANPQTYFPSFTSYFALFFFYFLFLIFFKNSYLYMLKNLENLHVMRI